MQVPDVLRFITSHIM